MRIGIVVSAFHWEISGEMLALAQRTAQELGASCEVVKVPGAYDVPLPAKLLLERDDIDGVVALGAILKGATGHDEVIGHAVAHALTQLSLEHGKPVVLGINGPKMTLAQARERIPRAAEVTRACIDLIRMLE